MRTERGQTLKRLVAEALQEKLARDVDRLHGNEPAWMRGFGALRRLRKKTRRIQAKIDRRFETVEPC